MSDIGRNEACPCGSDKKYKKCCLSRNIIIPQKNANPLHQSEKILIKTLTNELFQPMRLYYIIHHKDQLEACFKKLRCLQYNENLDDWVVEYTHEAANIGLSVKPKEVPKEAQPLIIATIYIENDTTMLVDVRSIERASKLIEFINKHVPRNTAQITHAAIYNQLITASGKNDKIDVDFDDIFNQKNIFVVDPERAILDAEEVAKKYTDKDERLHAIIQKTQEHSKRPLPKVEKFPVHFYEEGIKQFSTTCQMRQVIAVKHYEGDTDYSFYNLVQEMLVKNQNKFQAKSGWIKKEEAIQ